jgi:hypothetical protein
LRRRRSLLRPAERKSNPTEEEPTGPVSFIKGLSLSF